jgi:hypothetical protein
MLPLPSRIPQILYWIHQLIRGNSHDESHPNPNNPNRLDSGAPNPRHHPNPPRPEKSPLLAHPRNADDRQRKTAKRDRQLPPHHHPFPPRSPQNQITHNPKADRPNQRSAPTSPKTAHTTPQSEASVTSDVDYHSQTSHPHSPIGNPPETADSDPTAPPT